MSTPKVSLEVAQSEVSNWLDNKKISEAKREEQQPTIDRLVNSVMSGQLEINVATNELTQNLDYPIGKDEIKLEKLKYKARLTQGEVRKGLKNVSASDGFGIIHAYICALTGEQSMMLDKLDTSDYSLSQSIAGFFL